MKSTSGKWRRGVAFFFFLIYFLNNVLGGFQIIDDFLRFLQQHGDACLKAAQHLSRDCQSAYQQIRSLGLSHGAPERLARLLLEWSHGEGADPDGMRVKVALTHEEIAQIIGTSRETVTRTLADFRKKQIAVLKGSTLLIKNKPVLERLVGA